jgi:hypothetical protein
MFALRRRICDAIFVCPHHNLDAALQRQFRQNVAHVGLNSAESTNPSRAMSSLLSPLAISLTASTSRSVSARTAWVRTGDRTTNSWRSLAIARGIASSELFRRVDTVPDRHANIHDNYIGADPFAELNRSCPIGDHPNNIHIGFEKK